MSKTITVIGGGPGGYIAAIRAAQLGATVHLVEKESLGGTCLNVGCIPTKALIHTAEKFQELTKEANNGLCIDKASVDWARLQKHKNQVVKKLVRGVKGLEAANGVQVHGGAATLKDGKTVLLEDGSELVSDVIILATGSSPAVIPFEGHDLPGVVDSTGALSFEELPEKLCILGGGVIGCEFAYLFNALGVDVTVIEMMPQILPPVDESAAYVLREELTKQGIKFRTDTKLEKVEQNGEGLLVFTSSGDLKEQFECDKFIVAIGRRPNTKGIGLEDAGVAVSERGFIEVNENFETSVPGIFAIGDCNGQIMLAHAAEEQGVAAVEHAMGETPTYDGSVCPSCIYTSPECAAVGLTEQAARNAGLSYKVGLFPLAGNGKALIEGDQTGFVKIITEEATGKILGAHLVGPRVTDMVGELAVAMRLGATAADVAETIHPHPTVSESIKEAALDVDFKALSWPPKGKQQ
ncbi:MAG: dihydrolipoyl dehydrogenase [Clostridia bacterium]|nr:dihydrolipoyl dehydrogenase [Clostridia bacterium]